jgi:hypothetical protein
MKNKKTVWLIILAAFFALSLTACPTPNGVGVEPPESIELTNHPTKVKYNLGDDIDLSGMVLKANFKDGTEKEIDIKDVKVTGYDKNKRGNQTVTITYGGKSVTFDVNVIDPSLPTVATPTANPEAGDYHEAISVTLSSTTDDVKIYYTLDGKIPTEKSTLYTEAISITAPTTLKAFAVKENMNDSDELVAAYTFSFAAAPVLSLEPDNQKITYAWTASNPAAEIYDVFWKEGSDLSAAEVKAGTRIAGASSGGTITGLTNNMAYSVIVTANKAGYASVDSAVETAIPASVYIIMGGDSAFTATKAGQTVGTADQPIQTVIDAIRTNADGDACIIQFGDGDTALNIGTASVSLNNTGGTWELVELRGKITSDVSNTGSGVITIADAVSVTNEADIANTASNSYAVYMNNASAMLTLDGSPEITGRIRLPAAGQLTAASGFSPGEKTYTLEYASYANATIAVAGGANYLYNFTLYSPTRCVLAASGSNIVFEIDFSLPYIITGSGSSFTATQNSGTVGIQGSIQNVVNTIRTDANGSDCTIQFGDLTSTLNIGTSTAWFSDNWGSITLTGKITGSNSSNALMYIAGVINIDGNVSVTSTADITNTDSSSSANTIHHKSTGSLTINGGTVSATTGYAVWNNSTGSLTINGGTVSATTGYAVNNRSNGSVNISGGTVSATEGYAVDNYGAVNITGGTVSATTGYAVNNRSNGSVNISGGTVQATTGIAVRSDVYGKITVSGTAKVTSANTTNGTIYLTNYNGSSTAVRLEISGGTVQNTANNLNASTIYNVSTSAVSITGGTVSATGDSGMAVFNYSTGAVNISGGTVSATTGVAVYNNSTGAVNISGGTVSATTGVAVRNYSGKITISQAAGAATLITSANTNAAQGTIYLAYETATAVRLEITGGTVEITSSGNAVRNDSWGAVNISGGTVSATGDSGRAVFNYSGSVNISGGTVSATGDRGRAEYNESTGSVNISGGTVSSTGDSCCAVFNYSGRGNSSGGSYSGPGDRGWAVYNESTGAVHISGGTVSATTGRAVDNNSSGAVNISGGTVSATTGMAVYNKNWGKITISQAAGAATLVTSANTDSDYGTIYLSSESTSAVMRLEITGGTVSNTSVTTGNTIRNDSIGSVFISGGTVSRAGDGNYALYKGGTGGITVGSGATIVGNRNF